MGAAKKGSKMSFSDINDALRDCQCVDDATEGGRKYTYKGDCAHCCEDCGDSVCAEHVHILECDQDECKEKPKVVADHIATCTEHAAQESYVLRKEWWPTWEPLAGDNAFGEGLSAGLNALSAVWRRKYDNSDGLNLDGLDLGVKASIYPDANGRAIIDERGPVL